MKVEICKNKDGSITQSFDRNSRAPGILRVFVDDKRKNGEQRPGMKDIMADIAWRRSVTMTDIKKDPTFQKTIADYLQMPVEELIFRFNRHCGCAMCPCSPGILIQKVGVRHYSSIVKQIWVTISDEEVK